MSLYYTIYYNTRYVLETVELIPGYLFFESAPLTLGLDNSSCESDEYTDFDVFRTPPNNARGTMHCLHELLGFHISFEELVKLKKKSGASCMPYFGTVSSLLQSVDSHVLWGGSTDGLPSTLVSARSRFERDRTSLRCPPYVALTSV